MRIALIIVLLCQCTTYGASFMRRCVSTRLMKQFRSRLSGSIYTQARSFTYNIKWSIREVKSCENTDLDTKFLMNYHDKRSILSLMGYISNQIRPSPSIAKLMVSETETDILPNLEEEEKDEVKWFLYLVKLELKIQESDFFVPSNIDLRKIFASIKNNSVFGLDTLKKIAKNKENSENNQIEVFLSDISQLRAYSREYIFYALRMADTVNITNVKSNYLLDYCCEWPLSKEVMDILKQHPNLLSLPNELGENFLHSLGGINCYIPGCITELCRMCKRYGLSLVEKGQYHISPIESFILNTLEKPYISTERILLLIEIFTKNELAYFFRQLEKNKDIKSNIAITNLETLRMRLPVVEQLYTVASANPIWRSQLEVYLNHEANTWTYTEDQQKAVSLTGNKKDRYGLYMHDYALARGQAAILQGLEDQKINHVPQLLSWVSDRKFSSLPEAMIKKVTKQLSSYISKVIAGKWYLINYKGVSVAMSFNASRDLPKELETLEGYCPIVYSINNNKIVFFENFDYNKFLIHGIKFPMPKTVKLEDMMPAIDVDMGECVKVFNSNSNLYTTGLGPCISCIIYHPIKKFFMMTHYYYGLSEKLRRDLEGICEEYSSDLKAILVGGDKDIDFAKEIKSLLEEFNIELVRSLLGSMFLRSLNVIFDTEKRELYELKL